MMKESADVVWRPAAPWENLRRRAVLLATLRRFFDSRGFLEVETPTMSAESVVDRHLDPLRVVLFDDPRTPDLGEERWLQTSPEFAMKRLLAAGATAIYQVARAFRGGERGPRHNSEFTLVEWYRVGDGYEAGMRLLDELATGLLDRGSAERVSYREAFTRYANFDPFTLDSPSLAALIRSRSPAVPDYPDEDRDSWLNYALAEWVEPFLGGDRPTILYDYPASQAALAQVRGGDPPLAERFELYVDGVELANGYHELLDVAAFRNRASLNRQARLAEGKPDLPASPRFEAAMSRGLPACAGVALGFDRLVMVAVGARDLSAVIAFPDELA
ncbi:MAG: EF-P lysine aminoacylase EpmA [Planctomycetota bacterium]